MGITPLGGGGRFGELLGAVPAMPCPSQSQAENPSWDQSGSGVGERGRGLQGL